MTQKVTLKGVNMHPHHIPSYGEDVCLPFAKNRCTQEMLIDGDLFEDDKEYLQFIKSVQEYGVQNLALLKV